MLPQGQSAAVQLSTTDQELVLNALKNLESDMQGTYSLLWLCSRLVVCSAQPGVKDTTMLCELHQAVPSALYDRSSQMSVVCRVPGDEASIPVLIGASPSAR